MDRHREAERGRNGIEEKPAWRIGSQGEEHRHYPHKDTHVYLSGHSPPEKREAVLWLLLLELMYHGYMENVVVLGAGEANEVGLVIGQSIERVLAQNERAAVAHHSTVHSGHSDRSGGGGGNVGGGGGLQLLGASNEEIFHCTPLGSWFSL